MKIRANQKEFYDTMFNSNRGRQGISKLSYVKGK